MAQFIKIASTTDLAPGEAKCVEVGGKKIALFNLDGTFFAIDDTCTHRGGPLSEGEVSGEEVTCPWRGAVDNIKTGEVLRPPCGLSGSRPSGDASPRSTSALAALVMHGALSRYNGAMINAGPSPPPRQSRCVDRDGARADGRP